MSSQSVIKDLARKTPGNQSSSRNPVRKYADDTPNRGDSRRNNDREGDQDEIGHPKKRQQEAPDDEIEEIDENEQNDYQHSTANASVWRPASSPSTAEKSTPTLTSRSILSTERSASRQSHGKPTYSIAASNTPGLHTQHYVTRSRPMADAIEILEEHARTANHEWQARNFAIVAQLAEWTQNEDHRLMTAALRRTVPDVEEAYRTRLAQIERKPDPSSTSSEPSSHTVPTSTLRRPARTLHSSEHSEQPRPLKRAAEDDEEGEKQSQEESEVELEEQSEEDSDDGSDDFEDALERRPSPPDRPASDDVARSSTGISPKPRPLATRPEKEPELRDQHYEFGNTRIGRPSRESVPRSVQIPARTTNQVSQANLLQGSARSHLHSRTPQDLTAPPPNLRPSQKETLSHRGRGYDKG